MYLAQDVIVPTATRAITAQTAENDDDTNVFKPKEVLAQAWSPQEAAKRSGDGAGMAEGASGMAEGGSGMGRQLLQVAAPETDEVIACRHWAYNSQLTCYIT